MQVLHDVPFVVVSVLTGLFAIHFFVMELAVPLWLATRTEAPKSLVAVVLLGSCSAASSRRAACSACRLRPGPCALVSATACCPTAADGQPG